jgi:hypothetical protein
MDILQNILDNEIQKAFSIDNLLPKILSRTLKEKGIVLDDEQFHLLIEKIKNDSANASFQFSIDDKKALEFPTDLTSNQNRIIELKIDGDKEFKEIEGKLSNFTKLFPQISMKIAESLLKSLKKRLKAHQKQNKNFHASFNRNLQRIWGKPIDFLEMLYFIAEETGDNYNNHFRPLASSQNNFVFEVLTRLHARGCQITSEIILLLRNGFADGAHARWRTLHEISIVAYFIGNNGNELAERYILYSSVETYKATLQYQEHCEALGYDKLSQTELNKITKKYEAVLKRFGPSFKEQYGWASSIIGNNNPKFSDIEKNVGLEFMRPFYKMASHNVHANPKGIYFKLGLTEDEDILLTGPSNLGLFDPGFSTAISLLQITSNLLTPMEINLDFLISIQMMNILVNEINKSFDKADQLVKANK